MTLGISVTTDSALSGVRIYLGGLISGYYYSLERTVASGHYSARFLRFSRDGVSNLEIWDHLKDNFSAGGTLDFYDYEASFNESWTYTIKGYLNSEMLLPFDTASANYSDAAGVAPPRGLAMISDPAAIMTDGGTYRYTPNVTGTCTDFTGFSRSANVLGKHHVLGRSNPVISIDTMSGKTGQFTLANISSIATSVGGQARTADYNVISYDELYGWPDLLEDGKTLLFRNYWKDTGIDDFYFKVLGVEVGRVGRVVGSQGSNLQMQRTYTISFEEVDGLSVSDASSFAPTWATVAAANATWAEVATDHADWSDVLVDPGA